MGEAALLSETNLEAMQDGRFGGMSLAPPEIVASYLVKDLSAASKAYAPKRSRRTSLTESEGAATGTVGQPCSCLGDMPLLPPPFDVGRPVISALTTEGHEIAGHVELVRASAPAVADTSQGCYIQARQ